VRMSPKRVGGLAVRLGGEPGRARLDFGHARCPPLRLVREMRDAYNHRLRLVQSARQIGVKPTARLFITTVPTVRKWLRRYQQQGPSGLCEHSQRIIPARAKRPRPSK
jgi:helix-turn-helix protein